MLSIWSVITRTRSTVHADATGRRGRDSLRHVRAVRDSVGDDLAARDEHVHVRCTAPLVLYRDVNHVLSRDIDLGHFGEGLSGRGAR
eukprot:29760-Pelagococcus_subviridis.AAC.2